MADEVAEAARAAAAAQGRCGEALVHRALRLALPGDDLRRGDPDAVHDLRVATRRLRATLRLFRDVIPTRARRSLQARLRRLTRLLGTPRQADVSLALLAALAPEVPPDLGAALAACTHHLELRRARLRAVLRRNLAPDELGALRRAVRDLAGPLLLAARDAGVAPAEGAPTAAAAGWLGAWLGPRLRAETLTWQAALPAGEASPEAWHRFRIASKRLRYALEAGAPGDASGFAAPIRALRALQEVLGHQHDLVALAADLENAARWFVRLGAAGDAEEARRLAAHVAARAGVLDPGPAAERARAAIAACPTLTD